MRTRSILSSTVRQMRDDACHARHQPAYEAAKLRQPSFSPYRDLASVLTALKGEPEQDTAARDALTRALLLEHRARKGRAWTSALFAAYYPMLSRLRGRVVCSWPAEDIDQIVLGAFAEALDQVELLDAYPCALLLRQHTARLVFRRVSPEWDEQQEMTRGDHLDLGVDLEQLIPVDMDDAEATSSFLEAMLRAAGDSADMLRATVAGEESLRDYVERTVEGDAETRRRAYERLRFQRARVLEKLRASNVLAEAVPA